MAFPDAWRIFLSSRAAPPNLTTNLTASPPLLSIHTSSSCFVLPDLPRPSRDCQGMTPSPNVCHQPQAQNQDRRNSCERCVESPVGAERNAGGLVDCDGKIPGARR